VGGRTLSIKIKGPKDVDDALDMGAHWVCTRQPHVMELIEKFGIGYYPQNTTGTKIMQVQYCCFMEVCTAVGLLVSQLTTCQKKQKIEFN